MITHQAGWAAEGTVAVASIDDALFLAKETDAKEVMIIGEGEIYKTLFDKANRIYLTKVEAEPEADTYFPAIDPARWKLVSQKNYEADEKNAFNHSFQTWERI